MRALLLAVALLGGAQAQVEPLPRFEATLAGHALIPADRFLAPPADAPPNLRLSGRFLHADGRRRDTPGSVPGIAFLSDPKAPRPTGMDGPFRGQPVQGFSGIAWNARGGPGAGAWVAQDNGFGSKANSPDAMLMLHRLRPDWRRGKVQIQQTLFLHDPDGLVPFNIANSATRKRYLTGADFDIESIQPIGDALWLGDEFGPYLIRTDRQGKVTGVFETRLDGQLLRSPDHFGVITPALPGAAATAVAVRRSRGFEAMGASRDGRFLYPMLEGPLWNADAKRWEGEGSEEGGSFVRILEFDVQQTRYTGRSWRYRLEQPGHAIGDLNFIDADTALLIERDNGEGDASQACESAVHPQCFNQPARFKRVVKISLAQADPSGQVRKLGYVDLLDIADPQRLARVGGRDGRFSFPHWCIEGLDIVDDQHIVLVNDNNLGVAAAREFGRNEASEFILLRVPALLQAR